LAENNYVFQTMQEFFTIPKPKSIILRHDVDRNPQNAFKVANLENKLGIKSTYYFRSVPQSWDESIILEIADLNHEIGYHYENMDTANGNIDMAWEDFNTNLRRFQKISEIKTICMHGSPRSKYDNREIWSKYDYKELGIIAEPYYDINFDDFFYLTDTGRKWDGWKSSVRDKVPQQENWIKKGLVFHSTNDIIRVVEKNTFPDQVMFTFHPQRWHNNPVLWTKELIGQSMKNVVKRFIIH